MRIVLLGTAWPYRGGLAAFNERLMQEFAQQGDDVSIVTFTLQYPAFLFPGERQTDERPAPQIPIVRQLNSVSPLSWMQTARFIKDLAPDLLIMKYWTPFMAPALGYVAGSVRKNKKTKVICIADNIIPHEKHFYDGMLTKYFVKRVDAFVVMSKQVLQDLSIFDRKKMRATNPHPLFDNFGEAISKTDACTALALDPGKKYVLFFGFIRDYKGLDLLLEAFSDARVLQQDIHLIVAGEFYTERGPYDIMIKALGDKVHVFDRFISDAEVRNFFCAADIVAQPYKHATQSGVTQIAYHFNTPLLVTDVGGLPEMVPHEKVGYVVPPDSMAIAEALSNYFRQDRKTEFVRNMQEEKKRFGWDRLVQTIRDLYARC